MTSVQLLLWHSTCFVCLIRMSIFSILCVYAMHIRYLWQSLNWNRCIDWQVDHDSNQRSFSIRHRSFMNHKLYDWWLGCLYDGCLEYFNANWFEWSCTIFAVNFSFSAAEPREQLSLTNSKHSTEKVFLKHYFLLQTLIFFVRWIQSGDINSTSSLIT